MGTRNSSRLESCFRGGMMSWMVLGPSISCCMASVIFSCEHCFAWLACQSRSRTMKTKKSEKKICFHKNLKILRDCEWQLAPTVCPVKITVLHRILVLSHPIEHFNSSPLLKIIIPSKHLLMELEFCSLFSNIILFRLQFLI